MQRAGLLFVLAAMVIAGCGSSGGGGSDTASKPEHQAKDHPAKKVPKKPGDGLKACVEGVGYTFTRRDAIHIQVTSPAGRIAANATVHPTVKAAKQFDQQLQVPVHATAGRVVTVILPGNINDDERAVLLDCAHKP